MMGAILGFDRQQNKHNQNHHKHLNKHSHSQFTPGLPQVTRKIFCQALHLAPAANASHVTRHTSHVTRHTSHVTHSTSHVTRHTSRVGISSLISCCTSMWSGQTRTIQIKQLQIQEIPTHTITSQSHIERKRNA